MGLFYEIDESEEVNVTLKLSQVNNLAEFIDVNLIDHIRNDEEIDNILWLLDMCETYKTLTSILENEKQKAKQEKEGLK